MGTSGGVGEQRQNVPRERGRAQIIPARLSFELQNISDGMAGISGGRRGLQVEGVGENHAPGEGNEHART
jgi:hypothetical protein